MRRPPTVPVVLAGFAAFLDLYATQPLLPLLSRTFGASAFQAGLTITAPTLAMAIAAPGVGRLADSLGLRRVIVGAAFALAIATALAATSATLEQLIFWRFIQGIVTPGIVAGTIAYVHEVWPASHSGRATASYMTGTVLGGFTGRAIAGLVAASAGWQAALLTLGGLTGAIAAALWIWMPSESSAVAWSDRPEDRGPQRGSRAGVASRPSDGPKPVAHGKPKSDSAAERGLGRAAALFRNRRLVATFGVGFCVLFTQVAMFTYVTFHLAAPPYGLSTVALGWLFVVYLVGAVITPFGGGWVDRYGHRVGIGAAMAIGGGGALLTLARPLPAIVAGLALCATGVFISQSTASSFIGAVTTRDRALAVGMYSTFYYGGGSAGAALPAAVWTRGGWPACVALVVVVQIVGVAIATTQWKSAAGLDRETAAAVPLQ